MFAEALDDGSMDLGLISDQVIGEKVKNKIFWGANVNHVYYFMNMHIVSWTLFHVPDPEVGNHYLPELSFRQ